MSGVAGAQSGAEGRRFGRYQAVFRIASGGMAEVYAARVVGEGGFSKWVALKRMLPHLSEEPRFVRMFLDEARLASHINSPHVVSTLDLGRAEDGSLYLVMELVVGVTLGTLIKSARGGEATLPVDVAVELLAQSAQGLHDAHEACTPDGRRLEIVHRDVSPQNILVGVDGRARITDFGVARAALRETHTRTGELKGKYAYFSPEQAEGLPVDGRSDVFALGVVAWETLTRRRLFSADNPLATLKKLTTEAVRSPSEVAPEVPRALDAVILRALERDRDARYPSAAAFRDALRAGSVRPEPGAVEAVVRQHGGGQLAQVEAGMRSAPGSSPSVALATPAEATQTLAPSVTDTGSVVETRVGRRAMWEDAPRQSPSRGGRWAALGFVVCGVIAVGGWSALGAAPAVRPPTIPTTRPGELAPPPVSREAKVRSDAGLVRPLDAAGPTPPDAGAAPSADPRRGAQHARPRPRRSPAPAPSLDRPEPSRAPEAPPAPTPASPPASPRRGIRPVDDFVRELQQ